MAAVTIRNLPEATRRALKLRAIKHGRSTEAEIRHILQIAVQPASDVGSTLFKLGRKLKLNEIQIKRDDSPVEPANFS